MIEDNIFCDICRKRANSNTRHLCQNCERLLYKEYIKLDNKSNRYIFNTDRVLEKLEDTNKFFDPKKNYSTRELCTKNEKILFDLITFKLNNKYIILPQVNLQTIIQTDSMKRNDELYRNIDFCIFEKTTLKPVLAIELNGDDHYKYYKIKRDESVKKILFKAGLPLLTLKNDELYQKTVDEIFKIVSIYLQQKN